MLIFSYQIALYITQLYLSIAFLNGHFSIFLFKFLASSNLFVVHFKSFSVACFIIFSGFLKGKVTISFSKIHPCVFPSLGGSKKSIFIFYFYELS